MRSWKVFLLIAVIAYLLFAGVFVLITMTGDLELVSPATASRDVYGFKSGTLGVLRESTKKTSEARSADLPMAKPEVIPGKEDLFLLDWTKEKEAPSREVPDRWVETLQGDDQLELIAFATWTPEADDGILSDPEWKAKLILRDPVTLEEITKEESEAWKIPDSFYELKPSVKYHTPIFRAIFRSENMPYVRTFSGEIGDQRTEAQISYDLASLDDDVTTFETVGNISRYDLSLLAWHDTPITLQVQVLTGEPLETELPQIAGEQILIADSLRLQWLLHHPNRIYSSDYVSNFEAATTISKKKRREIRQRFENASGDEVGALRVYERDPVTPDPTILIRASSEEYSTYHLGIRTNEGVAWSFEQEEDANAWYIAETEVPKGVDLTEPLPLVFLPHVAELRFDIAGMPDQPNPRESPDLFKITIPRLTLPDDDDDVESRLIGFLSVAAQIEWDHSDKWDDIPPPATPSDRTFINETPQSLLNWYRKNTSGEDIKYDDQAFTLEVNQNEFSFWEKIREYLNIL